jgi:RimJ/RimL family protein N-acetyltransferase
MISKAGLVFVDVLVHDAPPDLIELDERRSTRTRFEAIGSPRLESTILIDHVQLREVRTSDLPLMYQLQADPEANRMAVTFPRTREGFDSHWATALNDPRVSARVILVGGGFVGYISCFPQDGQDHVGYWIDRDNWGRGIASQALQLLLQEVRQRPLVATAAITNGASVRVLQKNGFVLERTQHSPASERYPECQEALLILR